MRKSIICLLCIFLFMDSFSQRNLLGRLDSVREAHLPVVMSELCAKTELNCKTNKKRVVMISLAQVKPWLSSKNKLDIEFDSKISYYAYLSENITLVRSFFIPNDRPVIQQIFYPGKDKNYLFEWIKVGSKYSRHLFLLTLRKVEYVVRPLETILVCALKNDRVLFIDRNSKIYTSLGDCIDGIYGSYNKYSEIVFVDSVRHSVFKDLTITKCKEFYLKSFEFEKDSTISFQRYIFLIDSLASVEDSDTSRLNSKIVDLKTKYGFKSHGFHKGVDSLMKTFLSVDKFKTFSIKYSVHNMLMQKVLNILDRVYRHRNKTDKDDELEKKFIDIFKKY